MSGHGHSKPSLIEVRSLIVEFPVAARDWRASRATISAVDDVTLEIQRGETLALVGESGCGKTTLGRTLVRLASPASGSVSFDGVDLATLSGSQLRHWRRRAQILFQDPYSSLNGRLKVGQIVGEPLVAHRVGTKTERRQRVRDLLARVGLEQEAANRYPHAFSGGQRQRIAIARALALEPEFLVADEPVSALDVSVQAGIINLFKDLQEELKLTILFISHDLAVVRNFASRVAVMYLGKIVEIGAREAIFANPMHPYTRALLSAAPIPDPVVERTRSRILLKADMPSATSPPSGCRFHTRCPIAIAECEVQEPALRRIEGEHRAACHLAEVSAAAEISEQGKAAHV
jgi:oligopeptide transport system ATP-binding protein